MRKYFVRIEKNNYLSKGTAGHGFDGYFQTNMNKPASVTQPMVSVVVLTVNVRHFTNYIFSYSSASCKRSPRITH